MKPSVLRNWLQFTGSRFDIAKRIQFCLPIGASHVGVGTGEQRKTTGGQRKMSHNNEREQRKRPANIDPCPAATIPVRRATKNPSAEHRTPAAQHRKTLRRASKNLLAKHLKLCNLCRKTAIDPPRVIVYMGRCQRMLLGWCFFSVCWTRGFLEMRVTWGQASELLNGLFSTD